MISLKKSLSEMERLEELFRTSLQCYLAAVGSIEAHQVEAGRDLVEEHRRRLKDLRRKVAEDPAIPTLQQSSADLDRTLKVYSETAGQFFRQRQEEIRKILNILAEAAETLSVRTDDQASQLRTVARDLERATELEDLGEVRRRLSAGVSRLKSCAELLHRDNRASAEQLRCELKLFQRRLEQAEFQAVTDSLTGLANRRAAERLIAEKVRSRQRFSIMLFDLDRFKTVNDRYGHAAGDQVLQAFSRSLAEQFRAEDIVCRWGGDEFLVIVSSIPGNSPARARDVAHNTRGPYRVRAGGEEFTVTVTCSVGVAEHQPGETNDELFARADAFLYQGKAVLSLR